MRRLLSAVAVGALLSVAAPASGDTLQQRFEHPGQSAGPRVRWWWPGDAVSDTELRREISLLADEGFAGAEIQSLLPNFVPLTPAEQKVVNDFAEPSFFAHVRTAAAAAQSRGMSLDYTLGSAWPSGGGFAVTPELALRELTMARTEVHGGQAGPIKVALPKRTRRFGDISSLDSRGRDPRAAGWRQRLDAIGKVVAVIALKGTAPLSKSAGATAGFRLFPWDDVITSGVLDPSSAITLTDKLRADGTLDWSPPVGEWQIFVFKQYASDTGALGAAGQGPQLVVDHMNPAAFAAHAKRVGDPLGQHPTGIRSTFVDSLELMQDIAWGDDFLDRFRARRGYDLTPYLPFVLQPGWMQAWGEHYSPPYFNASSDDVADRVREDFRQTVSDLMFEGFLNPLVTWSHAHGLNAKFQAHGGALDIIKAYGAADIPETEDLVAEGDPLFMRFARSAADLYGRPLVSAESMVWKDRPYEVTPDELRRRADLIFSGGVNSIMMHGMDYRFHANDWPGWHAFQPSPFALGFSTMLAESNPVWPALKPLASYISRMQAVLRSGTPVVPVAYYYGDIGYYVGIEDHGAGMEKAEKAFLAAGYDYDRVNSDSLSRGRVVGRQLVSAGGHHYSALVLPPLDGISVQAAAAVERFAKAGLPIFFVDRAPSRARGLEDHVRQDATVRQAVGNALHAGAIVVGQDSTTEALRAGRVSANLRFAEGDSDGIVFVQRQAEGKTITFLYNHSAQSRSVTVAFPMRAAVNRWDGLTGRISSVAAQFDGRETIVPISIAANDSLLLVLDPTKASRALRQSATVTRTAIANTGWTLSVTGHSGRAELAKDFGLISLQDWRDVPALAHFSGTAIYRRSVQVPPVWLKRGSSIILDLGRVYDMATVTINGKRLPTTITAPYRVDLTGHLRPGRNDLEILVADTPENAMIDPDKPGYKNLKPVPAGLVGPISLDVTR